MPRPDELTFKDGLGERFATRDAQGRRVSETLLIRSELSSVPSFEFALNERLWLVEKFDHPAFLTVRNLVRSPGPVPRTSLVHDYVGGVRLSETLARAQSSRRPISDGATVFLLMEMLDAVAELHKRSGELSHGALAPERVVLADGKVFIADYVLGSALEQLRFNAERYWRELRIAVPSSAGGVRLDRPVDVAQIAMIGIALFAGRPLNDSEHIGAIGELLKHLSVPQPIRSWLLRALHMDSRRVFVHASEASEALRDAVAEAGLRPTPEGLQLQAKGQPLPATPKMNQPKVESVMTPPQKPSSSPTIAVKSPTMAMKPPSAPPRPRREVWPVMDAESQMYTSADQNVPFIRVSMSPGFKKIFKVTIVVLLMTSAFTAAQFVPAPEWLFSTTGTLVVESTPLGVEVFVNGESQGVTPLTLKVEGGRHEVELRGPGKPKIFNVFVSRGDRVAQYVEFPQSR